MSPVFTADDVGKSVETASGDMVGLVTAVDPGTAYVEPDPEMTASTRAALGWGGREDAVPLADDVVDRVTDDAVLLSPSFPGEDLTSDASPADSELPLSEVSGKNTPAPDEEYTPGQPVTTDQEEPSAPSGEDDPDPGAGAGERIDGDEERRGEPAGNPANVTDPIGEIDAADETDPLAEGDSSGSVDPAADLEELEEIEEAQRRELEVDPTELTDRDPEAEVRPGEDVGQRTDAAVEPDAVREGLEGSGRSGSDGDEAERRAESDDDETRRTESGDEERSDERDGESTR
ncbi:hypothetical protein [Natronosalvus rutilus]|uniref:Uncharacterized protein n=1 Tax=Natronosalvus rutilus TaxID=2953753 RepID=A0A9E7NBE7_9EURY|nr:hypothetical protein [Natronosalvus rutilus]UTF54306.1 hypothetical protein NGM29_03220 [Natronosalvus rutilus]